MPNCMPTAVVAAPFRLCGSVAASWKPTINAFTSSMCQLLFVCGFAFLSLSSHDRICAAPTPLHWNSSRTSMSPRAFFRQSKSDECPLARIEINSPNFFTSPCGSAPRHTCIAPSPRPIAPTSRRFASATFSSPHSSPCLTPAPDCLPSAAESRCSDMQSP